MKFPLFIAWRYLFSKKSTNAINLITGISVLGITIGMAALILELAVFNGFEALLAGLFNQFNPDLKVTAVEGKFFEVDSSKIARIKEIPGVTALSSSLEDVALFEYDESTVFATIKGVDQEFSKVADLESAVISGTFTTMSEGEPGAILGSTLRNRLGVNLQNPFEPLKIFVPRKKKTTFLDRPFKTSFLTAQGVFSFQQDYDNQYVFSDLSYVQALFGQMDNVSAFELALEDGVDKTAVKNKVKAILGDGFYVKDQYEQDEAFFKLMNIEKWMFYALFCLTLILIAFNMVGALWMLVLDKKNDISVLKSLGASDSTVFRIFLGEGLLISLLGILTGSILAVVIYYYHINYGLIAIPEGFIVDRYPMVLKFPDVIIAALTMMIIGGSAALMPARRARKISSFVRTE